MKSNNEVNATQCRGHILAGSNIMIVEMKETLPQESRQMLLSEAFDSFYSATKSCEENGQEFLYAFDNAIRVGEELQKLRERPSQEGDCKSLIMDGLNVTRILDVKLPIEVQSMMLMSALNYFEQATKTCAIGSEDFSFASSYLMRTHETLNNLENVYEETPKLGIFEKF